MVSLKFAIRAMDVKYRLPMLTYHVTTPRKEWLNCLLMISIGKDDDDDDDDDGEMK